MCAYTREPIDWAELEIDHIIPVNGDEQRVRLEADGIIAPDFDINGLENLLPTRAQRNNQKSNFAFNERSIVYYLAIAAEKRDKARQLYEASKANNAALKGYLQIQFQAETNNITMDDMLGYLRYQTEGIAPLRFSPEVDGDVITHANSQLATELLDRPFALARKGEYQRGRTES
jgi:hypothetical protein